MTTRDQLRHLFDTANHYYLSATYSHEDYRGVLAYQYDHKEPTKESLSCELSLTAWHNEFCIFHTEHTWSVNDNHLWERHEDDLATRLICHMLLQKSELQSAIERGIVADPGLNNYIRPKNL